MSERREPYFVAPISAQPECVTLVTSRRWAWLLTRAQTLLKDCDEVIIRRNGVNGHFEIGAIIAFEDND